MTVLLYDNSVSGNWHRVRAPEPSVVDHSDRAGALGGLSPSLNVPMVVLEGGRPLAESNAIPWYFADGTRYTPGDPYERAQVLQMDVLQAAQARAGDRGRPLLGRDLRRSPTRSRHRGQAHDRPCVADSASISCTRTHDRACSSAMSSRPCASTLNHRHDNQRRRSSTILPAQKTASASAMMACKVTPVTACLASGGIAAVSSSLQEDTSTAR